MLSIGQTKTGYTITIHLEFISLPKKTSNAMRALSRTLNQQAKEHQTEL